MPQTTGIVRVNGAELPYEAVGTGQAVVLLHAGIADMRMWDAQVAAWAPNYRVVRYDQRGNGRAKTASVEYNSRSDLLAVLDALEIERAVLVGNSRGGVISVDFTLEHPERVAGLVLLGSGVSGYREEIPFRAEELAIYAELEAAEEAEDWARINELEVAIFVDGFGRPGGRAAASVREAVLAMNGACYNRDDGMATPQRLEPPAAGRLHEISVPALVVWGAYDTMDHIVMGRHLAQGIAGAQSHEYPGAAHMISLEEPEDFNRRAGELLAAIG